MNELRKKNKKYVVWKNKQWIGGSTQAALCIACANLNEQNLTSKIISLHKHCP